MKKVWIFMLALMLVLCLCACGQTGTPLAKEYTFPEGTQVLGVDVTELSKEDAWSKLEAAAAGYILELTVDGVTVPVAAQDIDLTCSQDAFMAGANALEQSLPADFSGVISFNEGKLRALMSRHFNKDATEASISFDEATMEYVLVPHADGQKSNPNALVAAVKDAICTLAPEHSLTGISEILHPVRSADMPQVQEALAQANKMIGVKLTYTFSPADTTLEIPAETVRSFVSLGEDGLTPVINQEVLDAYVQELGDKYSIAGTSGDFRTTGGETIGLTVSYNGQYVDNDGLSQDIVTCLQEGISEKRSAPYLASGSLDMPYGGTYVEVNLSSQHLWLYKNGELIISTPLVSGTVAKDMCTPTGIYSIYAKSAGAYLTGEDYRTYVNYWMPFHYGYGLHDATWRGSFGGDIYLYSGSHGCVNLPLKAAATIFNNVSVGTKVILYGGKRSVPPVTQQLLGSTSYDVAEDSGSFKLDIKPKYSDPELTYSSSNSKVATVSEDGTVTIKGIGKAKITVSAEKKYQYTEAKITVTVNVHSACDEGRHTMGDPVTVVEPTCQPGLEKTTCTKCGHSVEKKVPSTQKHVYGEWVVIKEPTCSEEGVKEHTCTVCNIQKATAPISATGKHTEGDWVTTKEPTCVTEGSRQTKCTVCGTVVSTEKIPVTDTHIPGNWKVVKEATCTTAGEKAKFCKHCDKKLETVEIPAGHKPGDPTVTDATCTAEGKKVTTCSKCGEVLETVVIPAKGHSFGNGEFCSVCGERNPNFIPPTTAPSTEPSTEPSSEDDTEE